ncbi:outer membrane biogenesis protein BamB [Planctomycetes bacterium CA13]|uniref:Outer membrane biogenesis protein BamB n=1 Tax=Novipirellula herctigrandis TaxID=2527986 RepID=A0A5C5YXQ1_9BACT|nr:outer membrane biogenesis protein BamB [Planctomycetes bacterium CA13]
MMTPRDQYNLAFRSTIVCGLFAAVVAINLGSDYRSRTAKDPLNSAEYIELRAQLLEDPKNETLQESFRALDTELRDAYFDSRSFSYWGGWLLLLSTAGTIGLGKWAAVLRRRLPDPTLTSSERRATAGETDNRIGRNAVGGFAGLAVLLAFGFFMAIPNRLPSRPTVGQADEDAHLASSDIEKGDTSEPPSSDALATQTAELTPSAIPEGFPTVEELAANWPRFRGADGLGIVTEMAMLTSWNVETGEGILWKTEVPLPGNNSPVMWGDRIFLSGATETTREVMCFDAVSGELLWQKAVPGTPESTAETPNVMKATGFAAPTMATDGRRAYAIFANGDVGAFDFEGNLAWSRSLGIPNNAYGHASSLMTFENLLIVQFDQGSEGENLSRILALNVESGETTWEAPREEVPNSWPTPILIYVNDQPQLLTCGAPNAVAYDPRDGKEIWRADCLYGDVGPSPVYADGIVVTANEVPGVTAIKADGTGDVTETHMLWDGFMGVPDLCSPLATNQMVLLLTSDGLLTCYDLHEGGDPLWEHEIDASFSSSPTMIGENAYLFDTDGQVFIVKPTLESCTEVGANDLAEPCVTSPAVKNSRLYIRTETQLMCIGE